MRAKMNSKTVVPWSPEMTQDLWKDGAAQQLNMPPWVTRKLMQRMRKRKFHQQNQRSAVEEVANVDEEKPNDTLNKDEQIADSSKIITDAPNENEHQHPHGPHMMFPPRMMMRMMRQLHSLQSERGHFHPNHHQHRNNMCPPCVAPHRRLRLRLKHRGNPEKTMNME